MRGKVITNSPQETQALAARIAQQLTPGTVLALIGPLGAGKTCFVQGLAQGLEVPATYRVNSPTYTLLNIYPGRLPLYHFDWYRLEHVDALSGLDLDEYFEGEGISVIEWADKFPAVVPSQALQIVFTAPSSDRREITLPDQLRQGS